MISIVTPSFNQIEWLRLAVASVADQEGVDYEHIIQDGGTDGVAEILESEFGNLGKRLRVFVEKDTGMYDAVNRGLRQGQGEICAYLNCDEQYLPGTLPRVAEFFSRYPEIDLLFGDALITDRTGKALSYRRSIRPTEKHIRFSHLNTYSCATFFRRRILEQGHWLDPKWKSIGDAVWIYGMLKAGLKISIYPQLLSVFTLTDQNLSTNNPVSEREKQAWLAEKDMPAFSFSIGHVLLHRLRKLFAGAYAKRNFDYDIYTLLSPNHRVRFAARSLGGIWKTN